MISAFRNEINYLIRGGRVGSVEGLKTIGILLLISVAPLLRLKRWPSMVFFA